MVEPFYDRGLFYRFSGSQNVLKAAQNPALKLINRKMIIASADVGISDGSDHATKEAEDTVTLWKYLSLLLLTFISRLFIWTY